MKKKCLSILCLLLLFVSVALPVHAAGSSSRLVDNADYLTDSEETTLLNKLDEISTRQGLDIVIVTIPDLYGEDITAFADDFYDENGYQPDGILLLISDYDREWAISTAGYGITAFTDAGQEYLTGQFLDALSEGEYGIILLLRKLRDNGLFTEKELRKVASRIAAENSVELIISL